MKATIRLLNKNPMFDYREFCKVTQGIVLDEEKTFNPKDEVDFWKKHFLAMHSTLRCLHFRVIMQIPRTVAMQLVRHTDGHPQPEVESSRPDWTGKPRSTNPDELKWVAIDFTPESWIKMCQKRLCRKTEHKTLEIVYKLVVDMANSPVPFFQALARVSWRKCKYYGACNERESCGCYKDMPKLEDRF